ncbi:flr-2 [Pristionchus pacificus]|uniref:Flr-2 n=1 Tax=Pristionchus pacificus TaxID=54126 RepID=A0A2A6C1H2_PRIPA|nr:flr-2 [Pristionchus pacificus]|eukprot:PDM71947.1 flr-2 [Pristionchus pacificus]
MRSTEHRPAPGAAAVISLLILFVGLPHQVVAGPHKRGCHLVGRIVEIDDVDCEFMSVKVNACAGYCASLSFYDPVEKRIRAEGSSCCRMRDSDEIEVELKCESGNRVVRIPSALECECRECVADLSKNAASLFV